MAERSIPLVDLRKPGARPLVLPQQPQAPEGRLLDARGRPLRDLRISVTDRCNFRCSYCMPKEVFDRDHRFLPQSELLSFEEITRLARLFVAHGVTKLRLTGGEPLLRKGVERLVEMLAALRTPDGRPLDLTLTTNASLLARKARALKDAGLQRVTVSLDALDDAVFRRMNDVDFPVADVMDGLAAAQAVGLGPIKVNMVVKRGVNDGEVVPMARHFRGSGMVLRFIEYMDVGATNGWRMDEVLPSAQLLQRLRGEVGPLVPLQAAQPGETAERWAWADGAGEIGLISSVTQAFCGDCNRARLSTSGQLYLCLFGHQGHDLRGPLRAGVDDATLSTAIGQVWRGRQDRYSELRGRAPADAGAPAAPRVEMHYIGG
ncbi:GTP 3',8-cyclase MoaA [Aquabacterium sp. J223]|uniref:GTP 3',8-cyclase MoaA n=1 Tax=Aquabacterium sp. J223 TaxID=2898431 RepID=UPI0021AD99E0|nr:GTP 3',8-cyclase MoaA [Aquabacterium sp. J223]UUX93937.1 GTP 3',8-cyclase MoaA [Aquabacterium sp. J223]